ncbi:uncharacterized protein Dwil_GK26934 [Drosophila willistoni]|uniref:Uncharacterized protein n=1 Tax=Drosophila willistoni TaxID=7260 RepID=A0A0Q9X080_DROWI|nr:uncharacterized protein Dwil_GK26934 [Drosophila willistoni]
MLVLKQAKLERPVFRASNEIMFLSQLLLAVPLPRNSIFEHALNRFIAITHTSGLYDYWLKGSFDNLIRIGKMSYYQSVDYKSYRDLKLEDLQWFWILSINWFINL